jgi:hypothetical protein
LLGTSADWPLELVNGFDQEVPRRGAGTNLPPIDRAGSKETMLGSPPSG